MKISEYFNFANIKNYLQGTWNKFKDSSKFFELERHIQEQAIYRALLCGDCYGANSCLVCGCKTPDMFYAPNKVDSKGKWGVMLAPEEWEKFKLSNDLDMTKLRADVTSGEDVKVIITEEMRQKIADIAKNYQLDKDGKIKR